MPITFFGEDLRHSGWQGENLAMKAIAASVLAFAIIAATAITYQAAAKPRVTVPQAQAEPCIGLSCLPPSPPIKHRPAHRETLPPVW
jgi:hypothetical protein